MSITEAPTFSPAKNPEVNLEQDTISQNGHHPLFPLDHMIERIEKFNRKKAATGKKGYGTVSDPHTSLSINNLEEMLTTPEKPVGTTRLRQAMQATEIKPHQYWLNAFEAVAIEEALTKMPEVAEKRGRGKPVYPPPPNYVSIQEAKDYLRVKSPSTVVEYAKRAGIVLLREHGKAFVPEERLDDLKAARRQNRQEVSGDIDNRIEREDVALDLGISVEEVNAICRWMGLNRKGPLSIEGYQQVEEYVRNQQQQALPIK